MNRIKNMLNKVNIKIMTNVNNDYELLNKY